MTTNDNDDKRKLASQFAMLIVNRLFASDEIIKVLHWQRVFLVSLDTFTKLFEEMEDWLDNHEEDE